jgi:hypothetical protein
MSESMGLYSKEELISAGWKERQIQAALDEADEFGPSGHWLNTTGKPFYDKGRIEIAAYRIGLSNTKPDAALWSKWENSIKPTSTPVLSFKFHYLANECKPGISREFRSLRLSHPVMGRLPGTRSKEKEVIEGVLMEMVERASGQKLRGFNKLEDYLSGRTDTALQSLGQYWRKDVAVRPARRSSYISKGKSEIVVQRFIDSLALIHVGMVTDHNDQPLNIVEMLIKSPRIRFDRKSLDNT